MSSYTTLLDSTQNSGVPVPALTTDEFRARADSHFGFGGTERQVHTEPGWLTDERVEPLWSFCMTVAAAYAEALATPASSVVDDTTSGVTRTP